MNSVIKTEFINLALVIHTISLLMEKATVSNHTIAASNRHAYDKVTGVQIRPLYHDFDTYDAEITAGKTRIIQIYNDLKAGYELDKRGFRKNK